MWVSILEKASKECSSGKSIDIRLRATSDLVLQDIIAGRVDGGLVDQYAGPTRCRRTPT
ncbi:MAG: hypothetical protein U1E60_09560 [Reyranellaceae bacterium]